MAFTNPTLRSRANLVDSIYRGFTSPPEGKNSTKKYFMFVWQRRGRASSLVTQSPRRLGEAGLLADSIIGSVLRAQFFNVPFVRAVAPQFARIKP